LHIFHNKLRFLRPDKCKNNEPYKVRKTILDHKFVGISSYFLSDRLQNIFMAPFGPFTFSFSSNIHARGIV
jgi:non-homologous end joining protein Ku